MDHEHENDYEREQLEKDVAYVYYQAMVREEKVKRARVRQAEWRLREAVEAAYGEFLQTMGALHETVAADLQSVTREDELERIDADLSWREMRERPALFPLVILPPLGSTPDEANAALKKND